MRRTRIAAAGIAAVGMAMAACSSTPAASNGAKQTTLTISAADGETWPCSFNPFNPNTYFFSLGMTNEELYYVDTLTGKMTPWLATAYKWSDGNKLLTWTIRKGVKWSNGKPLTAADVAFTFNLIKKNPAIDLQSIDSMLQSVTQTGPYTVQMRFNAPAVTEFYYVADQISIVPESVWKSVTNPPASLTSSSYFALTSASLGWLVFTKSSINARSTTVCCATATCALTSGREGRPRRAASCIRISRLMSSSRTACSRCGESC